MKSPFVRRSTLEREEAAAAWADRQIERASKSIQIYQAENAGLRDENDELARRLAESRESNATLREELRLERAPGTQVSF